ncbi:hypothetical protein BKA56DRAFT_620417 [Ilyonectria sp. MPI-CAGE-AT-0026]|nr:hypothetical protein BKA56DRAFT_620417 [Ilyonectria sp. MPI-CAGE-AT-0026]
MPEPSLTEIATSIVAIECLATIFAISLDMRARHSAIDRRLALQQGFGALSASLWDKSWRPTFAAVLAQNKGGKGSRGRATANSPKQAERRYNLGLQFAKPRMKGIIKGSNGGWMWWPSFRSTLERNASKIEQHDAPTPARSQIHFALRARRPLVLNADVSGPQAGVPNHTTASREDESLFSLGISRQEQ